MIRCALSDLIQSLIALGLLNLISIDYQRYEHSWSDESIQDNNFDCLLLVHL